MNRRGSLATLAASPVMGGGETVAEGPGHEVREKPIRGPVAS